MTPPIAPGEVLEFLAAFERAQGSRDFDRVGPLLHPDAMFRFTEGDFRGIDEIRNAFEATWAPEVADEEYRMVDIEVRHLDQTAAVATFGWRWSGTGSDGPFQIEGRGTTVLVRHEDGLRLMVEHLSR